MFIGTHSVTNYEGYVAAERLRAATTAKLIHIRRRVIASEDQDAEVYEVNCAKWPGPDSSRSSFKRDTVDATSPLTQSFRTELLQGAAWFRNLWLLLIQVCRAFALATDNTRG